MPQKPIVSVIIPAYNEGAYIRRLLTALTKQDYKRFEVIISDAQSRDGTKEIAAAFADKLSITFIQAAPNGPSFGRNQGALHARGTWLLFLDADGDISDPAFIREMISVATAKGWDTATAKQHYINARMTDKIGGYINYGYTKLLARTKHPVAPGWCILTKRRLFEQLDGYNEGIKFGEDYDYVSRAGSHGFGFVETTFYFVDLRRAREEGWKLAYKGIKNELYRHTHGYNLENSVAIYEFGKHTERS